MLRRPSSRKLSPGVRDWLSLMPAEPEESGWSVPKPPMTKNIIGLPIVGSLCYKSVGLVKSIVWMSAIREMDAVRIVDGRSVHQAQRHISAVGHNKTAGDSIFFPATLTLCPLCASAFLYSQAGSLSLKQSILPIWAIATKTLCRPDIE